MKFINALYRLLSIHNDVRAASKGPGAYGRRYARKVAYRGTSRALRRIGL